MTVNQRAAVGGPVLCLSLLAVALLMGAPNVDAGAACSGCAACPCGGSSGDFCVDSGTGTKSVTITTIPFNENGTVDAGCWGDPPYSIDINILPFTVTLYNNTVNILQIPFTLIGDYTIGSCTACGGCLVCPGPVPVPVPIPSGSPGYSP